MSKKEKTAEKAVEVVTKPAEETYPVNEIVAASLKLFGWQPECTAAALKPIGKDEMTVSEVKEITEKFLRKEIK